MARAVWNGVVLADSDTFEEVEGNVYFPMESINCKHFKPCPKTSVCRSKGTAAYFDLAVGDNLNPAAAWYYANPKPAAGKIRNHVAFWKGVKVAS